MTPPDPGKGTGPVLCLSYDRVVKQNNGTFEANSLGGDYTYFTVTLARMLTEENETAGQC